VKDAIVDCFVDNFVSFRVVETESFKKMMSTVNQKFPHMSRRTLTRLTHPRTWRWATRSSQVDTQRPCSQPAFSATYICRSGCQTDMICIQSTTKKSLFLPVKPKLRYRFTKFLDLVNYRLKKTLSPTRKYVSGPCKP